MRPARRSPSLGLVAAVSLAFVAGCDCGDPRLTGVPPAREPAAVPEAEADPSEVIEDAGTPAPPDAGWVDSGSPASPDAGKPDAGAVPSAGCADETREGFLSLTSYPSIAGCSGAWTEGGVTRTGMTPTCNRNGGNTSPNVEGTGCSAIDLCAASWHVCRGKDEVAAKAPAGCGDAVPIGAPDKSLFFAVEQHSQNNTTCDANSQGDNDVFGCGNLGTQLAPDKGCGPLTRALASMQAATCGFNEAEPNLGPWQCVGGTNSHLHEGAIVTKRGCPTYSCSYDGRAVGNSDKGGVLCCKD